MEMQPVSTTARAPARLAISTLMMRKAASKMVATIIKMARPPLPRTRRCRAWTALPSCAPKKAYEKCPAPLVRHHLGTHRQGCPHLRPSAGLDWAWARGARQAGLHYYPTVGQRRPEPTTWFSTSQAVRVDDGRAPQRRDGCGVRQGLPDPRRQLDAAARGQTG